MTPELTTAAELVGKTLAPIEDLTARPNPAFAHELREPARRAFEEIGPVDPKSLMSAGEDNGLNGPSVEDYWALFETVGPLGKFFMLANAPPALHDGLFEKLNYGRTPSIDVENITEQLSEAGFAGDQLAFRVLLCDTLFGEYAAYGRPSEMAPESASLQDLRWWQRLRRRGKPLVDHGVTLTDSMSALPFIGTWIGLGVKGSSEFMQGFGDRLTGELPDPGV